MAPRASSPSAADAGTVELGDELTVNRLGFGAMRLTGKGVWGAPDDLDEARAVLRRADELAVTFIDTADSYGPEISERLIAETLAPYPEDLVIATKGGLTRPGPGEWHRDCRPERLRTACEESLERLGVERIDLYQLHAVDPEVPLEDSLGALAELRDEGKIHLVGVSNVSVEQLDTARELLPIVSVQNRYGVGDRASEPVLEACERAGLAFIPWFPLGAGELPEDGTLARVAEDHQVSVFQIAIAWLLARSPAMLPIPGTSSLRHLEENVAAASIALSAEEIAALDAVA